MTKEKNIVNLEIFNTIFTLLVGTILHFTYELSHNNHFIGLFSAVNESTWEHLKLLFFPLLITTLIGFFYTKNNLSNYLCVKTKTLFISLSFIIIFFYTYTGILGTNYLFLDIGTFVIAVLLEEHYALKHVSNYVKCHNLLYIIILIIICILFFLFTFYPPHIGLFKDPITNSYGINFIKS